MYSLIFNNNNIPQFLKVVNVKEQLFSDDLPKEIIIDLVSRKNQIFTVNEKKEILNWVKGDGNGKGRLILPGNSNYFYYAKVKTFINDSENHKKENITITFAVEDNSLKSSNESSVVLKQGSNTVLNRSTVTLYPTLRFEIQASCNKIHVEDVEINGNFVLGDVVIFNQETFNITHNSNGALNLLTLTSKRIKLYPGTNDINLKVSNVKTVVSWNDVIK